VRAKNEEGGVGKLGAEHTWINKRIGRHNLHPWAHELVES
jgi:hypothetical protein